MWILNSMKKGLITGFIVACILTLGLGFFALAFWGSINLHPVLFAIIMFSAVVFCFVVGNVLIDCIIRVELMR